MDKQQTEKQKGDISILVRKGTFLIWFDTILPASLTWVAGRRYGPSVKNFTQGPGKLSNKFERRL
jgi:hypothetical protein